MLYTVKIMRGKTTLKQFAVIADGDTTLQKFAADALGGQADDTAVMKKFGVCDSAAFARDSMTEFSLDLLDKVTVNDLSGKFVLIMCREKEIAPTPMSSFFDKLSSTGGGTFNHLPPKPTGDRYDMKIKGALIGVLETQGLGFQIQDVDMSGHQHCQLFPADCALGTNLRHVCAFPCVRRRAKQSSLRGVGRGAARGGNVHSSGSHRQDDRDQAEQVHHRTPRDASHVL